MGLNKKGYTIAEIMMSLMLVLLFGMLCFGLIQAGENAYMRIVRNMASKNSARISLNYIESRLRQADAAGSIRIVDNPFGGGNAIVIENVQGLDGMDLWICQKDDMLVEYYCESGASPRDDLYNRITGLQSFEAVFEKGCIRLTAGYSFNGEHMTEHRLVNINSAMDEGVLNVG